MSLSGISKFAPKPKAPTKPFYPTADERKLLLQIVYDHELAQLGTPQFNLGQAVTLTNSHSRNYIGGWEVLDTSFFPHDKPIPGKIKDLKICDVYLHELFSETSNKDLFRDDRVLELTPTDTIETAGAKAIKLLDTKRQKLGVDSLLYYEYEIAFPPELPASNIKYSICEYLIDGATRNPKKAPTLKKISELGDPSSIALDLF